MEKYISKIEKEFDAVYSGITYPFDSKENQAVEAERKVFKSFLKQSFIKYLQENTDFIDDKVREEINLETVEVCDVYLGKLYAYDEIKKSLQAQIKELETCK